jgi:hypothetical protein
MVFNSNANNALSFSIGMTRLEELPPLLWFSVLSLLLEALAEPRLGKVGDCSGSD